MNRTLLGTVAGVALIAGGVGYLLGHGRDVPQPTSISAPTATTAPATPSAVAMDEGQIKAAGIDLFKVGDGGFGSEVIAQGAIEAPPSGLAVLTAGADGRVTRISKQIGDAVGRGETIATIESRDAATISGSLRAAQARAAQAKANYAREQRLYDAKVTARADLEAARADYQAAAAQVAGASGEAAAAGVSGRFIAVRSPIAGRITAAPAILGSYVSAADELFRIANPAVVQAEVSVPVRDGDRIKPGAAAVIETDGNEVSARVRSITPSADPESRTMKVVLTPTSGGGTLTPGEYVRTRITASGGGQGTAVPSEAVQSVGGRDVVFVRTPKGFAVHPVEVGERNSETAQILNGVKPGDTVAGKQAFVLKAELEKGAGEDE